MQQQVDAVEDLARMVAGDDDQRFLLVFNALVNLVDGFSARSGDPGAEHVRPVLSRTAEPHVSTGRRGLRTAAGPFGPQADSIYLDPVFLQNAKKLIRSRKRIVGGVPTSDFPDCVAIGSTRQWCCTGTLVAPNVVVTAARCLPSCASRIFIGEDVDDPEAGQEIPVRTAERHPDYRPPQPNHDIAVLILDNDVDQDPRAIADKEMLESAATVRLAGYGNIDVFSTGGYGRRRMVDVPVASPDPRFGAAVDTEFVAGAPFLDRDICNGDSGGPAYVEVDDTWFLIGATSRATASTIRPCGDGGIYTQVKAFETWLRSVPGGHWG